MIELPEARAIALDLKKEILGKTIINVGGNFTDHKFTFYKGDPNTYKETLIGKKVTDIIERNYYVEIEIEDYKLIFRDGANIRYYQQPKKLTKSKLLITFDDNSYINITTSMYCFIALFNKEKKLDDEYYQLELTGISPLDKDFTLSYFKSLIDDETKKLSIKAFLATKQRILGIGNGVVQDIMFNALLFPKRKINTLNDDEIKKLYNAIVSTLNKMVNDHGRDNEKDIYGNSGGYKTIMSAKSYKKGCPLCDSEIKKEQYLGGSIYYCPNCQK